MAVESVVRAGSETGLHADISERAIAIGCETGGSGSPFNPRGPHMRERRATGRRAKEVLPSWPTAGTTRRSARNRRQTDQAAHRRRITPGGAVAPVASVTPGVFAQVGERAIVVVWKRRSCRSCKQQCPGQSSLS